MRVYTWLQLLTVLGNIPVSAALLAGHQAARLRSAALERSIPGLLSPPSLPLSLSLPPSSAAVCVCACVPPRARRIRQHAGTAFPKESSALSFVPVLLPLSLSLSAVIKRAGTICPFRQFIASCLFFIVCSPSQMLGQHFLGGGGVGVGEGGTPGSNGICCGFFFFFLFSVSSLFQFIRGPVFGIRKRHCCFLTLSEERRDSSGIS